MYNSLIQAQVDNSTSLNNHKIPLNIGPTNIHSINTDEFVNPITKEDDLKKSLEKIYINKTEEQELKELKTKGIQSKQELYEQQAKKEMAELNKTYAKIDQSLGSYHSNSKTISIFCKDFAYADGDVITIYLNDTPIIRNIELMENFKQFTLTLKPGLNTISFKALNQGSSGPNTASFLIFDDRDKLLSSNKWNLATGAQAILTIAKDQ